ncbi:hypothetical protein V6C27_13680 [Peptococcaceae bacterium 1198_IL3148]
MKRNGVMVDNDLKVQKPIYFQVSQLNRIDKAYPEDGFKSRADYIRTATELFLDLRDAVKDNKSDREVLDIVGKHLSYLNE